MSWVTYAARRTAFAALSVFLVITVTFLVMRTAPNTDLNALVVGMQRGGASSAEIEAAVSDYKARRGLEGSLLEQYVGYIVGIVTLDWGYSHQFARPVFSILSDAVPRTLAYIVPGVLAAYVFGVTGGLVAAYGSELRNWGTRLGAYVALGIPSIVLGIVVADTLQPHFDWLAPPFWGSFPFMVRGNPNFYGTQPWESIGPKYLLPAAVLAVGLVAGLYRHMRNNALTYRHSEESKMLQAKGADRRVQAKHALRNAALPLLSVSFAELMSVLALGAFVIETVFRIPGISAYTMVGVYTRDFPLIVGAAAVFAFIGITGSLLQDLLYHYLDPRVSE